jgi:hypothetical protein
MIKSTWFALIMVGILILSACTSTPQVDPTPTDTPPIPTETIPPTNTPTTPPDPTPTDPPSPTATPTTAPSPTPTATTPEPLTIEEAADVVINALADKDLATVADFVHPDLGVRFSPYTYVENDHQVFLPDELPELVGSDEIFLWGYYDGTGDPIELTFDDYYEAFVYSADFANPEEMAVDEELGWSSMINNIADFYPGSSFVEYHFSGFEEEYGGMDWASLRLVFIEENGTWFLVGIVNDQWTI